MKIIDVRGYSVKVDDDLYVLLKSKKWNIIKRGTYYAADGKSKYMHRLIMGVTDPKIFVDHINHDTLDNQRSNLRLCTHQQNIWNSSPKKKGKSLFVGVNPMYYSERQKRYTKWMARVSINGKPTYLGSFNTEEEAARAYDEKAKVLFGEFCRLNFSDKQQ